VVDNCAVCPIVFNVYEQLKIVFAFRCWFGYGESRTVLLLCITF
jgi:hypothetical protein